MSLYVTAGGIQITVHAGDGVTNSFVVDLTRNPFNVDFKGVFPNAVIVSDSGGVCTSTFDRGLLTFSFSTTPGVNETKTVSVEFRYFVS